MSVNRQVSNGTFADITKGAGSININSNAGGSNIKFLTSNTVNTLQTEKMRITEAGNVGIGTTTANARLDVRAQGALSTDIAFKVRNSADTADLLITNGLGNVGIGTSSPSQKLHVFGGIGRFDNIGTQLLLGTQGVAGVYEFTVSTGNVLSISLSGTAERLKIAANGNVGIGNIVPDASALLEVGSTTKGFLPPRMTNAQRLAISLPAVGLMVYCTDATEGLYIYKSTGWTFII
jgi:hypothetical protein